MDPLLHPLVANEEGNDTHDDDPANMFFRAGYLAALAMTLKDDDRKMCLRASRSLLAAAKKLSG